jgi:hypothetical protein
MDYKKMDRYYKKLQKVEVKKFDCIEIEEKAQPLYTFINWQEEWIFNLLASFHYIIKNTEEGSELQAFMVIHSDQGDDLFIYKEYLNTIEVDDIKIKPSNHIVEKKYERSCKLKNITHPDNDICTDIKDYKKIKKPIVSLFYYHILDSLNAYLDDITCDFPFSRIPFYAKLLIHGGDKFCDMYDNILNESYFVFIESLRFKNDIMNEEEGNIYFADMAIRTREVRKESYVIWNSIKRKCCGKMKINFLIDWLEIDPKILDKFF